MQFTVQRAISGRRVGARCIKPTRANRRTSSCIRYGTLPGSFTHRGHTGRNALHFSGRLRNRRLTPGRYRLRAIATDAATNKSRPAHARFVIRRR